MMNGFAEEAERTLRAFGWSPGRRVDVAEWRVRLEADGFRMHAAAERFLAEFGGLAVWEMGPGVTCTREAFEFDPLLAEGEADRFGEWSRSVGEDLFPLGELDHGRFFLGISASGVIYLVADWLGSFGRFPDGLVNLIMGVAPEPVGDQE
jgi:hypothetical protein